MLTDEELVEMLDVHHQRLSDMLLAEFQPLRIATKRLGRSVRGLVRAFHQSTLPPGHGQRYHTNRTRTRR